LANTVKDIRLYNDIDIVHKLSHQHLYTKFWIVNVDQLKENAVSISNVNAYAVPILIGNFLKSFNF